jgi:hypothetical protein
MVTVNNLIELDHIIEPSVLYRLSLTRRLHAIIHCIQDYTVIDGMKPETNASGVIGDVIAAYHSHQCSRYWLG